MSEHKKIFTGGYQCFHCLQYAVSWDNDFTFEDYGLDGEGIVHNCHCMNCGAEIEYYVSFEKEDEDGSENTDNLDEEVRQGPSERNDRHDDSMLA